MAKSWHPIPRGCQKAGTLFPRGGNCNPMLPHDYGPVHIVKETVLDRFTKWHLQQLCMLGKKCRFQRNFWNAADYMEKWWPHFYICPPRCDSFEETLVRSASGNLNLARFLCLCMHCEDRQLQRAFVSCSISLIVLWQRVDIVRQVSQCTETGVAFHLLLTFINIPPVLQCMLPSLFLLYLRS